MINPNVLRRKVLDMVYEKKSGHIGGSFSMAELTSVLYDDYDIGGKDKFILSKGHAVPIIYAILHELGRISDEDLSSFREINSPLQGQNDGWSKDFSSMYDNLRERISSFGWECEVIDGHDTNIISTKLAVESDKPRCIILNTMKGKGVSFMEDPSWHAKVPTEEQYEQATKELGV